jgi:CheY-like chemotaxis protein
MLRKSRVLIVEDEPLTAEDMRSTVIALGYNVVAVTGSGERAVELARDLRPDLVLADLRLSGPMDGREAGTLIQQSVGSTVIYVSANVAITTLPHSIQKPFSIDTVARAIRAALEMRCT